MKFSIFEITGGIGKHIAATAMLRNYKFTYPDRNIIVTCAWPEVFTNNDDIYRLYRIGNSPNLYKDYIKGRDVRIHAHEPYKETSHICKQAHLINTWSELVGATVKYTTPTFNINVVEEEIGISKLPKTNKPILLYQPFGGPPQENPGVNYSWSRDIHPKLAQGLVDVLSEKYSVLHVCYNHHPQLQNCFRFDGVIYKKSLFAMLKHSNNALLIDSSLQHACAALNKPATVLWNITSPDIFGYNINNNITPDNAKVDGTVESYLYDYGFNGVPHECPYTTEELSKLWNFDKVIEKLI